MLKKARIKRWLLESSLILLIGLAIFVSYAKADPPSCWSACDPTKKHTVSAVYTTCACYCGACITIAGTCCGYAYCVPSCSEFKPCCIAPNADPDDEQPCKSGDCD